MNRIVLMVLVLAFSISVQAGPSINDLLRSGDLVVSSHLSKTKNVVVGEQIRVVVDIETSTWFTKGTEIRRFSIDNAVVLMEQANVVNSVTHRNGSTYSTQRWEVPIYPLASGTLDFLPLSISVSVKHANGEIAGIAATKPMQVRTHLASENMLPDALWLVADNLKLSETITYVTQSEEGLTLSVGDSITRTIQIEAQGTSAMLVPNMMESIVWPESTRAYLESPQRQDKQVRGETTAVYQQSVTLIMQEPGVVSIPEIKLLWWDPNTQAEQWMTLPSYEWQVDHTLTSFFHMYWLEMVLIGTFVIATNIGLVKLWRELKIREREGRLPLSIQFWQALQRNQKGKAESLIYRKLLEHHHQYTLIELETDRAWYKDANELHSKYRLSGPVNQKSRVLKRLWRKVAQ